MRAAQSLLVHKAMKNDQCEAEEAAAAEVAAATAIAVCWAMTILVRLVESAEFSIPLCTASICL
ncbi:hypothetical protein D3C76_1452720 [compost metagenome]